MKLNRTDTFPKNHSDPGLSVTHDATQCMLLMLRPRSILVFNGKNIYACTASGGGIFRQYLKNI